jgi:hypothetical protein
MPMMKAYEREHLKLLEGILTQLTRIANAIEGDALEPEEVYSEETLNNLRATCNAAVPPGVVRNLEEELAAFNFNPPTKNKN